jgi:hypothetical protein
MRALASLAVAILTSSTAYAQSATSSNALWNDSGTKGDIGFWIYPVSGGCPDLRAKAKPLVFSPKHQQDEHAVSELQYCFQLPERAGGPLNQCRSGKVGFTRDAKTRRYKGAYSFLMVDGSKRQGSFEAQYCPKGGS